MCMMQARVAATVRVVVLMSPEEKAALDAKAALAGPVSTAAFVRRAVGAYDAGAADEARELAEVLARFGRVHAETLAQLDRTDRKLDDTFRRLAELDARAGNA